MSPSEKPPTWGQRLEALRHVPPLLRLVFQTHRGYTVAILALRIVRSFIPVAVLWIGKLIIDGVIAAIAVAHAGNPVNWWTLGVLVGLELGIAVVGEALARMHLAGTDFPLRRENALSVLGWSGLYQQAAPRANNVHKNLSNDVADDDSRRRVSEPHTFAEVFQVGRIRIGRRHWPLRRAGLPSRSLRMATN